MEEEEPAGSSKKAQKRKASDQPTTREKKKSRKQDKAYGVSRGIDFVAVACVINFDLPTTTSAYTHRVGRTARAGQSGLALSFVVPKSGISKDKNVLVESAKKDEKVFERIKKYAKEEMLSEIQEWDFGGRKSEVEGFRYRMEDALKAVTSKRVQEARRDEVRRELLNSEKLKVSHCNIAGANDAQADLLAALRHISLQTPWTFLTCATTWQSIRQECSHISSTSPSI